MKITEKAKALLIDDHPVVQTGIQSELQKTGSFQIIDLAGSIAEAKRKISQENYDIILCDLSLPDGNGLELLKAIRKNNSTIKLAVLTMLRDWTHLTEAKRLQVNGYILKEQSAEYITSALIRILSDETVFPDEIPEKPFTQDHSELISKYELLTNRERDILAMLLDGLLNKEIAVKLGLSIRTVEAHRASIMKKLNAKNTISLAVYRDIIR